MSASAHKTASEDVLSILRRSTITDAGITLPGTLDRDSYVKVNKFLEAAGAKWNRKLACHVFTVSTAKQDLEKLLETGKVFDKKQGFQEFYTPAAIVDKMLMYADIFPGHRVLEPSAGLGNIAKKIRHESKINPVCVELNPASAESLKALGFEVYCADFLTMSNEDLGGPFDRILMNSPFTKNQAYLHVIHALSMLKGRCVLVAIIPGGPGPRGKDLAARWESVMELCEHEEVLPPGAFKESGTNVSTKLIRLRSDSEF